MRAAAAACAAAETLTRNMEASKMAEGLLGAVRYRRVVVAHFVACCVWVAVLEGGSVGGGVLRARGVVGVHERGVPGRSRGMPHRGVREGVAHSVSECRSGDGPSWAIHVHTLIAYIVGGKRQGWGARN
jgi:hypothetical protein